MSEKNCNIVVSKFSNVGDNPPRYVVLGLFLCPDATFTICGCLHRLLAVMANKSTTFGLRQRVKRAAVFFLHASLNQTYYE
jgi:hypothetical protein